MYGFVWLIWLYQLSWKCKLATVMSIKLTFRALALRRSFFRNFHPLFFYLLCFTYETTNLPSTPERNVANSRMFYSNNYFTRSRDSLYFDSRWLGHIICFPSYLFLIIYLMYFNPHILSLFTRFYFKSVYEPYAQYFSYPWWRRR